MSLHALQASKMALGQLNTNKILDKTILQMLVDVPREDFVPHNLRNAAYIDKDIEIKEGRFLLAPLTFARLLDLAETTPSCRALIVGGGNGYAAAVFSELVGHVVSIDSDSELTAQAQEHAKRLGLKDVDIEQVKDMKEGYARSAPYDVIFINGAVEYLPEHLTSQLSIGGRMVTVYIAKSNVTVNQGEGVIVKKLDGNLNIRKCFDASAPVLSGFERPAQFVF